MGAPRLKMSELRSLRVARFWSQKELAKASGVHVDTIAALERGERDARLSTIRRLADALGVDPSQLVGVACG